MSQALPRIRVTTTPGIEDVAAAELEELLGNAGIIASAIHQRPQQPGGIVLAELPESLLGSGPDAESELCGRIWSALIAARSVYHIVLHIGEVTWHGQALADLAGEIAALAFTRMHSASSFRVSCSRVGHHPFQSPDVEVAVGSALQDRFGTPVDLVNHDVNVRVDIIGERCLCGYQLTGKKGLDRRYKWQYHPRVTLRTPIAYAMLRIAGFEEHPGNLLDPFCGSGTILLEAAALAPDECGPHITGSDRSDSAVAGCQSNLEAAKVSGRVSVSRMDARDLAWHIAPASLDFIVTNPPYGIRMGPKMDLVALYQKFLENAETIVRPGGVVALLASKRGKLNRVLESTPGFRLEHVRIIEIGGIYPGLFVLRRNGGAEQ